MSTFPLAINCEDGHLANTLVTANVTFVIDAFSAAAEPNRRRILQLLASQPRTVGEIAGEFPVTRSAISQHLLLLADAGLVEAEKVGRQRIYRVLPSGLQKLQAEIDRLWTDELDLLVADAHGLTLRRRVDELHQDGAPTRLPRRGFRADHEPERLRRWQTISAYVDLRAGGGYRWTITPGHVAVGTYREIEPGRRVVFGWGWEGERGDRARCLHGHRHDRARCGWLAGDSGARRAERRQAAMHAEGLEPLLRAPREARLDRHRRPGRVGLGA